MGKGKEKEEKEKNKGQKIKKYTLKTGFVSPELSSSFWFSSTNVGAYCLHLSPFLLQDMATG